MFWRYLDCDVGRVLLLLLLRFLHFQEGLLLLLRWQRRRWRRRLHGLFWVVRLLRCLRRRLLELLRWLRWILLELLRLLRFLDVGFLLLLRPGRRRRLRPLLDALMLVLGLLGRVSCENVLLSLGNRWGGVIKQKTGTDSII